MKWYEKVERRTEKLRTKLNELKKIVYYEKEVFETNELMFVVRGLSSL